MRISNWKTPLISMVLRGYVLTSECFFWRWITYHHGCLVVWLLGTALVVVLVVHDVGGVSFERGSHITMVVWLCDYLVLLWWWYWSCMTSGVFLLKGDHISPWLCGCVVVWLLGTALVVVLVVSDVMGMWHPRLYNTHLLGCLWKGNNE